jgi:hypothetical protein
VTPAIPATQPNLPPPPTRSLPSRAQAELTAAHEAARAVTAAVTGLPGGGAGGGGSGGGEVPEWKLREFADLRNAVATMWEQLDIPPEDVTAFLSECDLLAPYHPTVLAMYQDMYKVRNPNPTCRRGGGGGGGGVSRAP